MENNSPYHQGRGHLESSHIYTSGLLPGTVCHHCSQGAGRREVLVGKGGGGCGRGGTGVPDALMLT